ncbi:MAG: M67 family metallopeptidase [Chloroflexota bacterium]|nr:M67 family metallopeptidase [Chloroflexota bacterium]
MVELPRELYDEIIAHSQEGWPNEVCGLIGGKGAPERAYRIANADENPRIRYLMEPREQFEAMMDIEERGWDLYGIYHSHPSSEAYPSRTDRNLAFYPDAIYLICSLQDRERPGLRAFTIVDDQVTEQQLRITQTEPA